MPGVLIAHPASSKNNRDETSCQADSDKAAGYSGVEIAQDQACNDEGCTNRQCPVAGYFQNVFHGSLWENEFVERGRDADDQVWHLVCRRQAAIGLEDLRWSLIAALSSPSVAKR